MSGRCFRRSSITAAISTRLRQPHALFPPDHTHISYPSRNRASPDLSLWGPSGPSIPLLFNPLAPFSSSLLPTPSTSSPRCDKDEVEGGGSEESEELGSVQVEKLAGKVEPLTTSVPDFGVDNTPSSYGTHCRNDDLDLDEEEDGSCDEKDEFGELCSGKDENLATKIEVVMSSMRDFGAGSAAAKVRLEQCGVAPSPELVAEVLSRLRNDWSAAFTFFLWAGKQPGYVHSAREYHSMIAILGKMRRFDTAWSLINEMKGGTTSMLGPSLVTPQTLLILIRRYAAAHEVAKAINAFYALKKFGFTPGIEEFHGLLGALCRYKNVEDAEHLLLCNEKTFPFETKSFNIILNGWCNAVVVLREAKRFWKSMENRGIPQDVVSYGCMISCFSKAGNLNDVLKFFNRMKDLAIEPDRKVYNAVVYALAKGKCVKEAKELVKTMEERGITPNAVTFNSLIRPLCKARQIEQAWAVFEEMLQRGLSPSVRTFHAFFRVFRTTKEVFELLDMMKRSKCDPQIDTYIMLIRKFCRWRKYDDAYKLWDDICLNGPCPDRSAYIVLIHGLFLNGKIEDAHKYYEEMKIKGFSPEPRTDEMIQAWLSGKQTTRESRSSGLEDKQITHDRIGLDRRGPSNASKVHRNYLKPEIRSVTRERGFSLW